MSNSAPQPTFSSPLGRKPSKPSKSVKPLARLLVAAVLVLLLVGVVIVAKNPALLARFLPADDRGGGASVAEPTGDPAAEQEAAAKLNAFTEVVKVEADGGTKEKKVSMYLVISEPPEKKVTSVNFCGKPVSDEALALVSKLYRVMTINAGGCKITDDQLKHFGGLRGLNNLILNETAVTDAGLANLRPLAGNLGTLYLGETPITDRGLDDIAALTKLKILDLSKTKITDEGLKKLAPLGELSWFLIGDTEITDAGLAHLANLKNLSRLTVKGSKVTDAGIDKLKKSLPKLAVDK